MPSLYASAEDVQRVARIKLGPRGINAPKVGRALRSEGIPCQVVGGDVLVLAEDLAAWTRGTLNQAASNQPKMHLVNARIQK